MCAGADRRASSRAHAGAPSRSYAYAYHDSHAGADDAPPDARADARAHDLHDDGGALSSADHSSHDVPGADDAVPRPGRVLRFAHRLRRVVYVR